MRFEDLEPGSQFVTPGGPRLIKIDNECEFAVDYKLVSDTWAVDMSNGEINWIGPDTIVEPVNVY